MTDPKYWDCDCKEEYIHKKSDKLYCSICCVDEHNQPDFTLVNLDKLTYAANLDYLKTIENHGEVTL
tara:strand:+ start:1598 stop:1798 length:201 start_codon:yes stop_codon:yes gene_type:complete